jgi:hypothetical protein
VKDETVESLVRNLAEHLHSWGGVPLMCVFDRPKMVALKWRRNGEVTEWNPVFAYAMLEMGVGVELCWPQQPQQKGAVENLVGFVKSSFFKVRRFLDQADLQQQLSAWHREVNQERPCRAMGIIPAVRLAEELRPETATMLDAWLRERHGLPEDSVFPTIRGGRLSPDAIEHLITKYTHLAQQDCPSLKRQKVSPHVLRHTAAMDLPQHGVDRSVIALCGWGTNPRKQHRCIFMWTCV